jgi:hypothetical protein
MNINQVYLTVMRTYRFADKYESNHNGENFAGIYDEKSKTLRVKAGKGSDSEETVVPDPIGLLVSQLHKGDATMDDIMALSNTAEITYTPNGSKSRITVPLVLERRV